MYYLLTDIGVNDLPYDLTDLEMTWLSWHPGAATVRLIWEEAKVAALNRQEWHMSVCGPRHPLGCGLNEGQGQCPNFDRWDTRTVGWLVFDRAHRKVCWIVVSSCVLAPRKCRWVLRSKPRSTSSASSTEPVSLCIRIRKELGSLRQLIQTEPKVSQHH